MKLIDYEGKKVKIVSIDGNVFEGRISDYVYPEDNEPEVESIIMECISGIFRGKSVEFWEEDIETIEII